MEVSGIFNSISDCFEFLEKQVKFCFQFAIVSDAQDLIFETDHFADLCDLHDVMGHTFSKLTAELSGACNISGLDIICQNIADMHNGTKLFCISVPEDKPVRLEDSTSISRYCHDVQEPLRNISNFLQIIKIQLDLRDDEDVMTYIDYAIENVSTLSKWTRKLLNRPQNSNDRSFKLHEVIDQIRRLIAVQISQRSCRILCDENISLEKCEYFEIMRIFKNLIENSIKHAIVKKLRINIMLLSRAKRSIRILYRDNGEGLSKQSKDQIRKILMGKDDSLGLSICRDILRHNHGFIKLLKSEAGCAYEIKLPISYERTNLQ
ncbi:MAG: hypothetical protein LBJ92_04915 [Holosporales bacterium]|jgi:two-component sensor histidine kinase|nr:hypothetical protein [Holosporales bacterium]